ncbi:hypothetical protein C8F04DRAFT_94677 [Mycena alexandri]|uniref:Secreted protein n=1 Tax=Mycena alexandri TaxID=1745969 RepID=A0AAD6SK73_9AGAR|nr:hypothetical protein C8F04DRAFT_94677 [Mycena alexandri]
MSYRARGMRSLGVFSVTQLLASLAQLSWPLAPAHSASNWRGCCARPGRVLGLRQHCLKFRGTRPQIATAARISNSPDTRTRPLRSDPCAL